MSNIPLKNSNYLINLAKQSMKESEWQESITHLKEAISIKKDQPAWVYHDLGNLLVKQGCESEAILYYQKALDSHPTHPHILYFKIGVSLQNERKFNDAINAYQMSINIKNDWHKPYEKISQIMARQARLGEAIEYQKAALKIEPKNSKYRYSLLNLCQRDKNQSILNKYNYQIISLGLDCFSRTLPTRWGLKKLKSQGEISIPFDLSIHPYSSVCSLIENDFWDYLNPSFLKIFRKSDRSNSWVINQKYNCAFNHEQGRFWSDNKFQKFIERYKYRVENFYELTKKDNLLFLLHIYQRKINPDRMLSILKNKFKNNFFKLVLIDTRFQDGVTSNLKYVPNSNLIEIIEPLPYPDYVWHKTNHYQSELGLQFEKKISTFLSEIITENFPEK